MIRHVGLSNVGPDQLQTALEITDIAAVTQNEVDAMTALAPEG